MNYSLTKTNGFVEILSKLIKIKKKQVYKHLLLLKKGKLHSLKFSSRFLLIGDYMKKKNKILLIIIGTIILISASIFVFANNLLNKVNYTDWSNTKVVNTSTIEVETEKNEEIENSEIEKIESENIQLEEIDPLKSIPEVSNILLIGEENVYKDDRGRTDSMMILSLNKKDKSIKLISLMRDSYVKIPNHKDNRLNAAYSIGGVPLLIDTIQTNFGITINNTILVNFEAFEKIIDILGGVDIEITQTECEYLNKTNYISKEESRICVPGINHFNGIQALGYARIRYVKGITGETNDFGRTNRQRTLLLALFEKYKTSNLTTLLSLMNEILPYITTDMTKSEIINYIKAVLVMMPNEIETFRIPMDDSYKSVSIKGMSVLNLDWDKNREGLKSFIYGDLVPKEINSTEIP